jgi:hypothetical protein
MTTDGGSNGNRNANRLRSCVTGVLLVWGVAAQGATFAEAGAALAEAIREYIVFIGALRGIRGTGPLARKAPCADGRIGLPLEMQLEILDSPS